MTGEPPYKNLHNYATMYNDIRVIQVPIFHTWDLLQIPVNALSTLKRIYTPIIQVLIG